MEKPVKKTEILCKEDVKRLYQAFLSLCDYVEENAGCSNCPLYSELCGNADAANVICFSESLKNIRCVWNKAPGGAVKTEAAAATMISVLQTCAVLY